MSFNHTWDTSFILVYKKSTILFHDQFFVISMVSKDGVLKTYTLKGKETQKLLSIQVLNSVTPSEKEFIVFLKFADQPAIFTHELFTNEVRFIQYLHSNTT
jgi:hypothetical protein